MKLFKKALAGVAMAASLVVAAQASTVDGVTWNENSTIPIDFSAGSVAIRQMIAPDGSVSGFGTINTLNGTSFCSGCQLTFQFGGYTPTVAGAVPQIGGATIQYTGGWVNVYVAPADPLNASGNTMSATTTGEGVLWLSLAAHTVLGTSFTGNVDTSGGPDATALKGSGLLDVTGGDAESFFDTNSKSDGADFSFSTSFTSFQVPGSFEDAFGTGNFNSKTATQQVPEPASIALLGLGLVGMAATRRRKSSK